MSEATNQGRIAAEHFARFQQRPEIRNVTARYAEWAVTPDGIVIHLQLSCLAVSRLSGQLPRSNYRKAIRELARSSGIAWPDFVLLAKCGFELVRCALGVSVQIPWDPARC